MAAGYGLCDDRHAGFVIGLPRRPCGGDGCMGGVGGDVGRQRVASKVGGGRDGLGVAGAMEIGAAVAGLAGGEAVRGA